MTFQCTCLLIHDMLYIYVFVFICHINQPVYRYTCLFGINDFIQTYYVHYFESTVRSYGVARWLLAWSPCWHHRWKRMATRIGQLETSDNIFHGYTDEYAEVFLATHIYIYRQRYRCRHKHRYRHIGIQMDDQHRWTFWDILVSAMASWEAHD